MPSFPHIIERIEFDNKILDVKLMIQPSYPAIVSFVEAKSRVTGNKIDIPDNQVGDLLRKCCAYLEKDAGILFKAS